MAVKRFVQATALVTVSAAVFGSAAYKYGQGNGFELARKVCDVNDATEYRNIHNERYELGRIALSAGEVDSIINSGNDSSHDQDSTVSLHPTPEQKLRDDISAMSKQATGRVSLQVLIHPPDFENYVAVPSKVRDIDWARATVLSNRLDGEIADTIVIPPGTAHDGSVTIVNSWQNYSGGDAEVVVEDNLCTLKVKL